MAKKIGGSELTYSYAPIKVVAMKTFRPIMYHNVYQLSFSSFGSR